MHDIALVIAGIVGIVVSIAHGTLIQKLFVKPILTIELSKPVKRLVPLLLHFSTIFWLIGGICLIAAPFCFDLTTRNTTCIVVAAFYVYGVLANFWATRGKHFGWMLLAIAVGLIFYGA